MRISDWSSDVCSSDLEGVSQTRFVVQRTITHLRHRWQGAIRGPLFIRGMKMPAGGLKTSDGQAFLPRKAREARGATNSPAPSSVFRRRTGSPAALGRELVHRIVLARGFQGRFAGEIFLMVFADVAAAHILVDRKSTSL